MRATPQEVLDRFGFIVLASCDSSAIGKVLECGDIASEVLPVDGKLTIIGIATEDDWKNQMEAYGVVGFDLDEDEFLYRAVAE